MPPKLAHRLKVFLLAWVLAIVSAPAALAAEPAGAPTLMGLTRAQVFTRLGRPKSQIVAGNRVVMFFDKERLVLRDGIVIEEEQLSSEPVARRPPALAADPKAMGTTGTDAVGAAAAAASGLSASPNSPPVVPVVAPTPDATVSSGGPGALPAPEPKIVIKQVRRPTGNSVLPIARTQPSLQLPRTTAAGLERRLEPAGSPANAAPNPEGKKPAVADGPTMAVTRGQPSPVTGFEAPEVTSAPPINRRALAPKEAFDYLPDRSAEVAARAAAAEELAAAERNAAEQARKVKLSELRSARAVANRALDDVPARSFFSVSTGVTLCLVLGGALGYYFWRSLQRRLDLAASTVEEMPPRETAANDGGVPANFTLDFITKLEWKRFENLVVDYYVKTGVLAERSKLGPMASVQVRIFWKGEERPFAYVQCISHPVGLLDVASLQALFAALSADQVKRGYVITTGKFSVSARDYAEEKHITLLPGDIFVEKLNALPPMARAEMMRVISEGDYQTPSCPKCDARMVLASGLSPVWKCPAHSNQVIPSWS